MVEPERPQTIWRMRVAYCNSAFAEQASVLRYTYIVSFLHIPYKQYFYCKTFIF